MIETALVEGVRIRWAKPTTQAGGLDGDIVRNPRNFSPMTYLGNTQPQARGGMFNRAPQPYRMPANSTIPYSWLNYITGCTTYIEQNNDVLTGFMSGCLIARGTYDGKMSVFHLGTTQNPNVSKQVKANFRTQLPPNATGFYPHTAWSFNERAATGKATDIIALVSSGGSFYSILLCHGNQEFIVAGIKKVPSLSRAKLMASLF